MTQLEQLNKKYLLLMKQADEVAGRKEAVSLIHKATQLAEQIGIMEAKEFSRY
jgi:hypothetical protein